MKPLLRRSDLGDPPRFYIVTRYTEKEGPMGKYIIASTKYEVTAEELAGIGLEVLPLRDDDEEPADAAR